MVNPYAGFGGQPYQTPFGIVTPGSPEEQQVMTRMQFFGMSSYPQQFPMGGTYTSVPFQGFGMQGMMQMMLLLMQLLMRQQGGTTNTIDGSKGDAPQDAPGGYGENAFDNLMTVAINGTDPNRVDIKYSDKAENNINNAIAFSTSSIAPADRDGDGKLSTNEFVGRWMNDAGERTTADDFETMDRNKDGYIDRVELAANNLAQDTNNDGTWTVEEGKAFSKLDNEAVGKKMDELITSSKMYAKDLDLQKSRRLYNANAVFLKTDKNDDGFLSKDELSNANKDMFKGDVNSDNKLDRAEALGVYLAMDENKDWRLTPQEIDNQADSIFKGTDEYAKSRVEKTIQDLDLVKVIADWQAAHKAV